MGLREIASVEGLVIPASALGKMKMILQVLAGCAVILTAESSGAEIAWNNAAMAGGAERRGVGDPLFPDVLGPDQFPCAAASEPRAGRRAERKTAGCPHSGNREKKLLLEVARRALTLAVERNESLDIHRSCRNS